MAEHEGKILDGFERAELQYELITYLRNHVRVGLTREHLFLVERYMVVSLLAEIVVVIGFGRLVDSHVEPKLAPVIEAGAQEKDVGEGILKTGGI